MNRKGLELFKQRETDGNEEELIELLKNPLLLDLFKLFIKN